MNEDLLELYDESAKLLAESLAKLQGEGSTEPFDSVTSKRLIAISKIDSLACEKAGQAWRASVAPPREARIETR